MLDSKWGSSSGTGPCTTATGASDDGSEVDVLLVVVFVPDPVIREETVAEVETTPTPGTEDEVDDTAVDATGGGGRIGEGDLWIRLGIRCSTDAASARAA